MTEEFCPAPDSGSSLLASLTWTGRWQRLSALMAEPKSAELMEKIVSLCKRRGFIFQSSEIYGGINGFWDYGPLGAELKRNVKEFWWNTMTRLRDDVAGLDATIIMHPKIWKASGHVDTFSDPMVDCKTCKGRFRADQMNEIPCPQKPSKMSSECHGEKTEARPFNLMFETFVGPVRSDENIAYLRPETAQAIFAQFKNVLETSRQKVPFGIAQMGKAFRNEVTPRNFTFRSREFEQMELEFFIKPDEAIEAICGSVAVPAGAGASGRAAAQLGLANVAPILGRGAHSLLRGHRPAAHNARGILAETRGTGPLRPRHGRSLFKFPFGTQELEGIAARSDFDLSQHQRFSGKPMSVFDEELKAAWPKLAPEKQADLRERYCQSRLKYLTKTGEAPETAEKQAGRGRGGTGQGLLRPARDRAERRRGSPGAGADLQRLRGRPGPGREGQDRDRAS